MKYVVCSLLCVSFGLREAAAQQVVPPLKQEFLDSTWHVLPSAAGARYRRETEWRDSTAGEVRNYYLSTGQLEGRMKYEHVAQPIPNGVSESFGENGQLLIHDEFAHGRRTGELRTYYPNGQLKRRERYGATGFSNGGECFAPDGTPTPFFAFEIMPRYPEGDGGPKAIIKAVMRNFKYPKDALRAKIEGRALVAFSVTEQGTVTDVHMKQSLSPSIDANAMQAVYQLKRFEPGMQDGKPVKVAFTLPISLRIQ
jgi:protein TonB